MSSNGGRTGPIWRALTTQVYTEETHCGLCGQTVDLTRPYRNPVTSKVDPLSKSVNHRTPIADGGRMYDRANLELAHLGCQHKQGGHIRANQEARRQRQPSPRSRDW